MCGLLGFTGHSNADPGKIRVLLLENESRGRHSTGLYGSRLMRKTGAASDFIKDPNFDHVARAKIVIGHTRMSTGGAHTKENAHPYVFGVGEDNEYLVGAHNGSIVNEFELEEKIKGFKREEVDSKSLYKAMAMMNDPKALIEMLEGHVALAFKWGKYTVFFRRDSRPLYIGRAKEGWYFSSLKSGLQKISIPDSKIYSVAPDIMIPFIGSKKLKGIPIKAPRIKFTTNDTSYNWDVGVDKKLIEELTGKKHTPVRHVAGRTGGTQTYMDTASSTTKSGSSTVDEIRLIGQSEMRANISLPAIYGRHILMNYNSLVASKSYVSNTLSNLFTINTNYSNRRIRPMIANIFHTEDDSRTGFWVDKHFPYLFEAPLYIAYTGGHKKYNGIRVKIDPRSIYPDEKRISKVYSKSMYMIAKVDQSSFAGAKCTKELLNIANESVGIYPLSSDDVVKDGGFIDLKIPNVMLNSLKLNSAVRINIHLYVIDASVPGFAQYTNISVPVDSETSVIAMVDRDAHSGMNKAMNELCMNERFFNPNGYSEDKTSHPINVTIRKAVSLAVNECSERTGIGYWRNGRYKRDLFQDFSRRTREYRAMLMGLEEDKKKQSNKCLIHNSKEWD